MKLSGLKNNKQRLAKKKQLEAKAKAAELEAAADAAAASALRYSATVVGGEALKKKLNDEVAKSGGAGGAFKRLWKQFEAVADAVRVNDDGSVTFTRETEEPLPTHTKTAVKDGDTGVARVTEITTTVISSVAVTETKITLRPSNLIFQAIANWQAAQVKLKSLLSFSQISVNIAFNCNMEFPPVFANLLANLEVVNVDLMPSLGLNCRFNGFDYCDTMVATCMGPIALCGALLVAYLLVELGAKAAALRAHQLLEERKDQYVVPDELEGVFDDDELDSCKTVFATCDSDGGGSIDASELAKLVRRFEPDLLDEEVDAKVAGMLGDASSGDGDDEVGAFLMAHVFLNAKNAVFVLSFNLPY